MADMNELLEQATAQAVELTKNAAEASAVLDALAAAGRALEEQIEAEAEAMREAVHGLTQLLERTLLDVQGARADAVADLDAAAAEAGTTGTEIAADFDAVQSALEALGEHEEHVQKDVDARVEAAEADLDRVVEAMEAADASASTHFRAANAAAASFKESREKEKAELESGYDSWKKALGKHVGDAETLGGNLMLGFEDLEKDHSADATELIAAALRLQEASVSALQTELGQKLADGLKEVADAFVQSLEGYARRSNECTEAVEKRHDALEGKAGEVTLLADEIQTSILHSVSVLG